jgi:hypothetical protein
VSVSRSSKERGQKDVSVYSQSIQTQVKRNGQRSSVLVRQILSFKKSDIDQIADFVNPKDLPEGKSIVEYLVEETDGGLDYTYDATGVVRFFSLFPRPQTSARARARTQRE